jgi:CRISPR-associated endoribonuclease Cas6
MLDSQDQLKIPVGIPSPEETLRSEIDRARGLLGQWEIVHLRIAFRGAEEIEVPFAGSLLRGAFAGALYRLACVRKDLLCPDCVLRNHCLYPALFLPEAAFSLPEAAFSLKEAGRGSGRRGSSPRPFVIVPPERISTGPGTFELKLLGPPAGSMPYLIHALVEMARAGIGHQKVPLHVTEIESLGPSGARATVVWDSGGLHPERCRRFSAAELLGEDEPPAGERGIVLDLRTPLRMKEEGKIRSGLSAPRLVRSALRRLIDLGESLGQRWPRDWPATLEAAEGAIVRRQSLRWFDWGRYSRRQGRAMRLGGQLGTIELDGVAGELVPLLRTAAFFHLGKSATFGLGAIELKVVR